MSENIILDKSFDFAVKIVKLYKKIIKEKKEFVLSKQIMKSGTSIGALVREAQHAESKADFIHKLSIALKEAHETEYWLQLLKETDFISESMFESLNYNIDEILSLLVSIIKTTKENHK